MANNKSDIFLIGSLLHKRQRESTVLSLLDVVLCSLIVIIIIVNCQATGRPITCLPTREHKGSIIPPLTRPPRTGFQLCFALIGIGTYALHISDVFVFCLYIVAAVVGCCWLCCHFLFLWGFCFFVVIFFFGGGGFFFY